MKNNTTRLALALAMLFCCSSRFYAQLSPTPTLALTNVTEASQYGVLYQIDIPVDANYSSSTAIVYAIDNSSLTLNYTRVAYFMQLDNKWVWVSMNKFNSTNAELGVPYNNSGIIFQQTVTAMNVVSSPSSGVTNTTGINGNIEIWPDCYSTGAALSGIGGNGGTYDFNDSRNASSNCYGSFQVHNYGASETVFAWNSFMNNNGSNDDVGIGNNSGNTNPDWTFMYNSGTYTTRKLWILVDRGVFFTGQPSTLAMNGCLNGTLNPLSVTAAIVTNTISNYQWYSNTTASTSGGTLVATHTSSLTTDSYTPSTTAPGTLYYYCVVNGTGSNTATSNISGGVSIENPTLTISGTGTICPGGTLNLSAASTAAGSTFTWSTGENTANINVSPGSTTNYTVAGTSTLGCIGVSSPVTVTVNTTPVISAANGTICNGASFVLSPGGAVSYTYSSGSATVMPTTTSNYTISGTSSEGCVGTNSLISVTVNALPIVSITGTTAICVGSTATLTANGASTYTWNTNSNASSISVNPTLTTTYSLTGTSSEGCVSSVAAVANLTVNALPLVSITGTNEVCFGSSVNLTANGASTYTWNTTDLTASITVTPSANATYSVSGTSADGCVSAASAVTTISVNALPTLTLTSSSSSVCAGSPATLTASGANTYTWDNGSTTSSIVVNPSANTSYSVSGTNNKGCVTSSLSVVSITAIALPTLTILHGNSAMCAGGASSLMASGAVSYTWAGAGVGNPLGVSPTITTSYTLTGTSSVGCVSSPVVVTKTVNPLPVIAISATSSVCAGTTTSLTASGAPTYAWSNGLGASTVVAVSPTVTTIYTLTGISSASCVSYTTATLTVNPLPNVVITGPTGICTGQSVTLSVSGAPSYSWSTGSTSSVIVTSPTLGTIYYVTGTDALGCVKTSSQAVSVASSLSVSINGPSVTCSGNAINLIGLGGATYTWNTGATSTTITPTPTTTTTYSIIGASGTCSNTATMTVIVNPIPTLAISGTAMICNGNTTTLSASGASTYVWSSSSTSSTSIVNPSITTSYTVIGTNTSGCSNSQAVTVTVNPLPLVSISGNTMICSGSSAILSANGASSYTWSSGATTSTISVNPSATTTYSAIGVDANGCMNASTITTLMVNPNPVVSVVGSNVQVCPGTTVTLAASGASSYSWTNGMNTGTISITPSITAGYSVTGTNTTGCSSSSAIFVTVYANPTLTISGPTLICSGETANLNVSGASSYTWNNGSNATTIAVTPTVLSTYSVSGASTEGCSASSAFVLNVGNCTGLNTIHTSTKVNLYPNPSTGVFTIELEETANTVITVRNVVGQIVLTKNADLINSISISEFNNGVYYVSITKNNAVVYTKALIKN